MIRVSRIIVQCILAPTSAAVQLRRSSTPGIGVAPGLLGVIGYKGMYELYGQYISIIFPQFLLTTSKLSDS